MLVVSKYLVFLKLLTPYKTKKRFCHNFGHPSVGEIFFIVEDF